MNANQSSRGLAVACLAAILVAGCSGGGAAAPTGRPAASGPAPGGSTPAGAASIAAPSNSGPDPAPAGGGGGSTGHAVTDASQAASLLGPGDFSGVGVSGAGAPTVHNPEPGAVYAVYAGKSGGTGGIELDVFVGDGATDVFASMSAPFLDFEGRGKADLPAADDALLRTDNPLDSGGTWAGVAVRKGRLVFLIAIPGSDAAEGQLVRLAKLVLERGAGLE